MAARLVRLALAGFKSFAEPASLEIAEGLTGIVGPNGCGKSNVVEALRWVMGENSARSLRGGEMDDVIFAGTAHRASRNLAEVTISLEDAAGAAVGWPDAATLAVSRRIERGGGSQYRVNGREVRARDVQTLFADLASGARSSGMISQGRVGALIDARPAERRQILEEAAGVTGLYARRHEAELKLAAAAQNLERAQDLCRELTGQLEGLRRQARQAARYRGINETCRAAEVELMALERARVTAARCAADDALTACVARGAAATAAHDAALAAAAAADARVAPLREQESRCRTARERARLLREQSDAALADAGEAAAQAAARVDRGVRDLAHAHTQAEDARRAIARIAAEEAVLAEDALAHPRLAHAAAEELTGAAAALRQAEQEADAKAAAAAALQGTIEAAAQRLADAEQGLQRARLLRDRAQAERAALEVRLVPAVALAEAAAEAVRAEAALAASRAAAAAAAEARTEARAAAAAARDALAAAEARLLKLRAEVEGLAALLQTPQAERWRAVIDRLRVTPGFEAALGAALGDALGAALEAAAPRHWRRLPPLQPAGWPEMVTGLAAVVEAPPALGRALAAIGIAESAAAAERLQPTLLPGQILVTRDGGVWRWDGYRAMAGAPSPASVRLAQRNRLAALLPVQDEAQAAVAAARSDHQARDRVAAAAARAEAEAERALREAGQQRERLQGALTRLQAEAEAAQSRLGLLAERLDRCRLEADEAAACVAAARERMGDAAALTAARLALTESRAALAAAQRRGTEARAAADQLRRAEAERGKRQSVIAHEQDHWRERVREAEGRLVDLAARQAEAVAARDGLALAPALRASHQAEAARAEGVAQAAWQKADGACRDAERAAQEAARKVLGLEHELRHLGEERRRGEAAVRQAIEDDDRVAARLIERFGPELVLPAPPSCAGPAAEERARRRLDRLRKERDEMGPVNLRAELEADEIAARIAAIERERAELDGAIAKLRGSVGQLNREGRARLAAVFAVVDQHFQALFSRMFEGGRAYLAMVGSEDPLEAGLEIYAQPPGKKLASLSLLSGGEQALTALSLIFAVFRCLPAPVAVLDEVDAPLDDANVGRFCGLLAEQAREAGTRFLVVTHHPLTMARMDRLYGVTMQERGVSRLLSVDLGDAVQLAAE